VVTPDETYQGDEDDYMGSDKYAQIYVPQNSDRIECQDTDGNDLGEHYGDDDEAYYVEDDMYWSCFQFLAKHDARIRNFMDSGIIIHDQDDYENHKFECDQCGTSANDDDAYYSEITGGNYCDLDCFQNAHEDYIKEQIEKLLPPMDTSEEDAAKVKLEEFINSPDSPEAKFFTAIKAAADRMNAKNRERNPNYEDAVLTPAWYLANTRSALRADEGVLERVFKGELTKEDFARVDEQFLPLYEASKTGEEKMEDIFDQVKDKFDLNHTNVKDILVNLGILDPSYVKQSRWVSPLLV
jgi:hypothetical protein